MGLKRVFAGAMGAVLLVGGGALAAFATASAASAAVQFGGWQNANLHSLGRLQAQGVT